MLGRPEPDEDEADGGPASGRLLMVVVLVLAVASTMVLVLADNTRWLRLGVLAALWAALVGVLLAVRFRKQVAERANEVADLQSVYELELEREVAARREYELEVEATARKRVDENSRADLAELRAELRALRESLEHLTGGEVLVERFALRAQSTRMRTLAENQPRVVPAEPDRPGITAGQAHVDPATEMMARPTRSVPGMTPVARPTRSAPGLVPVSRSEGSAAGMAPAARSTQSVPEMTPATRPVPSMPGMTPVPAPSARREAPRRVGGYRPDASRPQIPRDGTIPSEDSGSRRELPAVASLGGPPRPPQTQAPAQRPVGPPQPPRAPQAQPQQRPPAPQRQQPMRPMPNVRRAGPPPQAPPGGVAARLSGGPQQSRSEVSRPNAPGVEPPRPAQHNAPPPEQTRHRAADAGQHQDWQAYREWRAEEDGKPHHTGPTSNGWQADPDATGAHTAGRSVTELLAAHGNQDQPSRHRRRAAE